MLKFTLGNAKLQKGEAIFDLPAGHSCPFAGICKSSSNPITGKITDGPKTTIRCYAATGEARSSAARRLRWNNFEAVKACKTASEVADVLGKALPASQRVRIHSSGDFFSQTYFDGWLELARRNPDKLFYAYTKSLLYWTKRLREIPSNFKLTASYGGKHDVLISYFNLKSCKVVASEAEAKLLGLEIDHDDSHAYSDTGNFALLIHGTQPAGTPMSKAWQLVKMTRGGYSREKNQKAIVKA